MYNFKRLKIIDLFIPEHGYGAVARDYQTGLIGLKSSVLIVGDSLIDLLLCVHNKGSVMNNRLINRLAKQDKGTRIVLTG